VWTKLKDFTSTLEKVPDSITEFEGYVSPEVGALA
jgi:hypothetical protein